ncbi:DUF3299 domain-containing protein [Alteromonas sp. ASW11-36]|uniref:DUF3299 domain-containing protein n=1 Tax=Alteromonas arenosi TaxID=3055817 RepID=A0ABT7SW85_9ALTE|nr:DUF3299 domain-containing protein [Alteromonas sp. ASW11-36]MDM7860435.1 DUF3299 domain-containing protein [Alteromonas sp. ASW11-36]
MRNKLLLPFTFIFLLFGMIVSYIVINNDSALQVMLSFDSGSVYTTDDQALLAQYVHSDRIDIQWSQLLPEYEKQILSEYQTKQPETVSDLTEKILRSIEASSDLDYQAAMRSTQTVSDFDGKAVSIPGFVVPIEFHPDQTPSLVFIVPYYGACIHFPPPPPNQIIFARLSPGFQLPALSEAYLFSGILNQGLYEDPLGTSAYELAVSEINEFIGQPDDFRSH